MTAYALKTSGTPPMFLDAMDSSRPDLHVGRRVRLLIEAPPLKKGYVYMVRAVMTYGNRESPEDVFYLEHEGDRSTALRREIQFVEPPEND